jgi:hypothetical protein
LAHDSTLIQHRHLSCFYDTCIGVINIKECHQESHVPSWQIVRLDVLDKPIACEAMLRVEDETLYGSRGEAIANELVVGNNIIVPCESGMENNSCYYFVIKQNTL